MIVPAGKGFYVCNKQLEKLSDAHVFVNDIILPFDQTYFQYRLTDDIKIPCRLSVSHPTQPKLDFEKFCFDSQSVFLLNDGDTGYWQGGVRVPVKWDKNTFYLSIHDDQNESARIKTDNKIIEQLEHWDVSIQWFTQNNKFGNLSYRILIVNNLPVPGQLPPDFSNLLSTLKGFRFIGPLLQYYKNESFDAMGLTDLLEIRLLDATEPQSIFKHLGLELLSVSKDASKIYSVRITTIPEKNILERTSEINAHESVRYANNILFKEISH